MPTLIDGLTLDHLSLLTRIIFDNFDVSTNTRIFVIDVSDIENKRKAHVTPILLSRLIISSIFDESYAVMIRDTQGAQCCWVPGQKK